MRRAGGMGWNLSFEWVMHLALWYFLIPLIIEFYDKCTYILVHYLLSRHASVASCFMISTKLLRNLFLSFDDSWTDLVLFSDRDHWLHQQIACYPDGPLTRDVTRLSHDLGWSQPPLFQAMKCHDFEVSISNDEGYIPEYASRLDNEYTASCYIPSEVGKVRSLFRARCCHSQEASWPFQQHFKINFINFTTHFFAEARCYIDGRLLTRTVVKPMTKNWADGVQVTDSTVRPFLFSVVQISSKSFHAHL